MFIRKNKNRSGSTSVIVIDKSGGRFRTLKTIGISSNKSTISELCDTGREWICTQKGEQDLFVVHDQQREEAQVTDYLYRNKIAYDQTNHQKNMIIPKKTQNNRKIIQQRLRNSSILYY